MMTRFWSGFIILLTALTLLGLFWLLFVIKRYHANKFKSGEISDEAIDSIQETNKPMPRWWCWLFGITIVISIIYLALYPGLGNIPGILGWTSTKAWEAETKAQKALTQPLYEAYAAKSFEALMHDPKAMETGQQLYLQYCTMCHGKEGKGMPGFPNLTDNNWLYGNTPDQIKHSILFGRIGFMPGFEAIFENNQKIEDVVQFVLSLSQKPHDANNAERGKKAYQTICAACHGKDGSGSQTLGAPNLANDIWRYGGTPLDIEKSIRLGRQGQMPAHQTLLSKEEVHVLAAYVFHLSQ